MKIKKGDTIQITVGKDKGKNGNVEKVFAKDRKVLVEGVNQFKRHMKARVPGQKSEIITITKPMGVSKVMLVCPSCKKPTRVGYKITKDTKLRSCKKCGHEFV